MAKPSALDSLLANGQSLLQKAEILLGDANKMFSDKNIENLTAVLDNTREVSDALLEQRSRLDDLLARLDSASQRAGEAAVKVSKVSDNANALLENEGRAVLGSLNAALKTIETTSARIDQLTQNNQARSNQACRVWATCHRRCANCATLCVISTSSPASWVKTRRVPSGAAKQYRS
ncbi:hypothetical protein [Marinobacter similis]|uniref:hypothetical protein n=1 Tax=Marinobacter similis TaxID=1420916 RepID=UPI000ACB4E77|nr:hypothetical protein [Marinobacter similis]